MESYFIHVFENIIYSLHNLINFLSQEIDLNRIISNSISFLIKEKNTIDNTYFT